MFVEERSRNWEIIPHLSQAAAAVADPHSNNIEENKEEGNISSEQIIEE